MILFETGPSLRSIETQDLGEQELIPRPKTYNVFSR